MIVLKSILRNVLSIAKYWLFWSLFDHIRERLWRRIKLYARKLR